MVNALLNLAPRAQNFRLESRYPCVQLFERQWIEILPQEQSDRIISPAGQIVIKVHDTDC